MRTVLLRHGGVVEKFIGDAVVGTFGIPEAHENDALRAVRAALEMQEAAAEIDTELADPEIRVAVRIAIDGGETYADEARAVQGRVAGDVFNTAARLQGVAGPNEIVVSATSERMLRGQVECAPMGAIELKGKANPVDAYRVVRLATRATRPDTPLVGRARSLQQLTEALRQAVDDQAGILVTVLGEPGVGKSRLAEAFALHVRDRATVLEGQTPPYGDGVTFAPLIELLAEAAGQPQGEADVVAGLLRRRVAGQPDGPAIGDRLAQILGVAEASGSEAAWAVRRLLEVLASERPVVLIMEDLHWAETPMLDLAGAVVDRVRGPVVFLCLARPELLEDHPTWGAGKPRAITWTLPPLAPGDARRLATHLLGEGTPDLVVDRISQQAEGNPLYLEQLAAMLADHGLLVDGRWVGSDAVDIAVPPTLHLLLAERLDRLSGVPRLVLERASVEGRRFRVSALGVLAPEIGRDEIGAAIAELERKNFLHAEGVTDGRWQFTHALLREAAYRGLSKQSRAELHERLADWLLVEDADRADVDESVALHLQHAIALREDLGERDERTAAMAEQAGHLFAEAGLRAFAGLDYVTSRDLLGRAATLLSPDSQLRLSILPNLGAALADSGLAEASETMLERGGEEARAVRSERAELRIRVQLLSNRIYGRATEEELEAGTAEVERAMEAFHAGDDGIGLAEGAIALDNLAFVRGRAAEAQRWSAEALRYALPAGRPREATQAAGDLLGFAIIGPHPFERFPVFAHELPCRGEPISDVVAHALLAAAALASGDQAGFGEEEEQWRELVEHHGLSWLGAAHALEIAIMELAVGQAGAAERRLRGAREYFVATGNLWYTSIADGFLCESIGAQGRREDYLRLADAFAATPVVNDPFDLIKLDLALARAHLLRGSLPDAEARARQACARVARTDFLFIRASALELLAKTLDARDRKDEASAALDEAHRTLVAKGILFAAPR